MISKILLTALCAPFLVNCDTDKLKVEEVFEQALKSKHGFTKKVQWEIEDGHYVAEFYDLYSKDAEAWFDLDANWVMSIWDISKKKLPKAVKSAFDASEYAEYRIEDIDKIDSKANGISYAIDVEKGDIEYELIYDQTGTLIRSNQE